MRYLLFLFLYHYSRKIEGMVMGKVIGFSDSLTLTILMFCGEFFGGLAVIIYQKYFFSHKRKKKKINIGIKLIQGNSQIYSKGNNFKILLLIFFAAFFDFSQFIISCSIPEIAILSPTSDQRLCIIMTITSSLLCTFALKIKTGRHQIFSLRGMGICCFIIFIIEVIYKSKGVIFGKFLLAYFLVICRLSFISFIDVIEKYLAEYNNANKFIVLSAEGFFGIILCVIYSLLINKNPIESIDKVYGELSLGKKIMLVIFLILYFVLSAGINIYKIICNIIYTPMVKSLPAYLLNPLFIIYYFIYQNDFTIGGEKNYFYFIINIILSIIIDFFAFIYNEFIILNCFGLQKDTHREISQRAFQNYSLSEMEEIDKIEHENDFSFTF